MRIRYIFILLCSLFLLGWLPTIFSGNMTGASGGPPSGTDFLADSACVAAWDFTSGSTHPDLCETDSVNDDVDQTGGTAWSFSTFDGLTAARTNGGYRYMDNGSSTDFDPTETGDYTYCTMHGIPTGVSRVDWAAEIVRVDFMTDRIAADGGDDGYRIANGDNTFNEECADCYGLDKWYVTCQTFDYSPQYFWAWLIDDGIESTTAVDWSDSPGTSSENIYFGCNQLGANCQDSYIKQAFVLSRVITSTEACQFAAYGMDGESWDRSSYITCE